MPTALILHSSIDGHTITICRHLQTLLHQQGVDALLQALTDCEEASLHAADLVVIGASIRYGRHRPAVLQFIRTHRAKLAHKAALFSVNLVARKPDRNSATRNPYLRKLIARSGWQPALSTAFAGRLDYPRCGPGGSQHDPPDHVAHQGADRSGQRGGVHRLATGRRLWPGLSAVALPCCIGRQAGTHLISTAGFRCTTCLLAGFAVQ